MQTQGQRDVTDLVKEAMLDVKAIGLKSKLSKISIIIFNPDTPIPGQPAPYMAKYDTVLIR
jgi:hypothetical protein